MPGMDLPFLIALAITLPALLGLAVQVRAEYARLVAEYRGQQ